MPHDQMSPSPKILHLGSRPEERSPALALLDLRYRLKSDQQALWALELMDKYRLNRDWKHHLDCRPPWPQSQPYPQARSTT
jgi:hypothetical protein